MGGLEDYMWMGIGLESDFAGGKLKKLMNKNSKLSSNIQSNLIISSSFKSTYPFINSQIELINTNLKCI